MVVQVEQDEVEKPFVAQLEAMGWTHVPGREVGTLDAGEPFLTWRLEAALRRINVRRPATDADVGSGAATGAAAAPGTDEGAGADVGTRTETGADSETGAVGIPWMDSTDVRRSIAALTSVPLGRGIGQANLGTTELLLGGHILMGPSAAHGGPSATVQYIEWHEERSSLNEFTVVSQLRVRNTAGDVSVPDIVLFVNGIPLVAVECKSPDLTEPVLSAVRDLRHYAGNPLDDEDHGNGDPAQPAGVPELFRTVQLLVAATGESAGLGTVTSGPEHFHPWRSVAPESEARLRSELPATTGALSEQQKLVGVVLRPASLLVFVRHYVIPLSVETESGGTRTVKAVARHQQYRAAEKAVRKLLTGRARGAGVPEDERGGLIWHTQGSGKSLTMTFLVRRIHQHHRLGDFMVVVVTDRTQLQEQLTRTLKLSESEVETAESAPHLQGLLRDGGRRVVFGMIQKYGAGGFTFAAETDGDGSGGDGDDRDLAAEYEATEKARRERRAAAVPPEPRFPQCSTRSDILVLVDEAHRSHTSLLHAALRKAVPNAAKIGFTGTPIMTGKVEDTRRIFSGGPGRDFLDVYRMAEAERDGVVVRIRYEGRTGEGKVFDKDGLDVGFEDLVRDRTHEERRKLLTRWPTERDVAESLPMIRAKAEDMLEHWVTWVLPNGDFKAQVAAVSRKAAVAYHHALRRARDQLLIELGSFDPESVTGVPPKELPRRLHYLHHAHQFRALLRRVDFVPVISPGAERKNRQWLEWSDRTRQEAYIARFHQPFPQPEPDEEWVATTPLYVQLQNTREQENGHLDNPWSQALSDKTGAEGGRAAAPVPDPVHPDSPIAFLIVKSMLLTGFDAPREQVLYLDRPIRDAELLQAVARVNRPMPGKDVGYVVDYHGVFEHLNEALAAYDGHDVDDTMRSLAEEIEGLEPAAKEMRSFLHEATDADLDNFTQLRAAARDFEDEELRFEFDRLLHEFLIILDRALPHEKALEYVDDARRWTMLQKRIRGLYRMGISGGRPGLRHIGRKIRAMIAEHLEGPEIDRVIAPVLLGAAFDEHVRNLPPDEAAAEMRHALRFHLEERVKREDPEKYARLSERLEEILRYLPGRFEEQIEAFGPLMDEMRREEEEDPATAGLSPLEQRVHRLLNKLVTDAPGVVHGEEDFRPLVLSVCDTAAVTMGKAGYQGKSQDLDDLAAGIQRQLVRSGLRPAVATDWAPLRAVAERLAAHAADNRRQFLARYRGE